MNNEGVIYAFEKDKQRVETLKKMSKIAGASCIQPICSDFLNVDPLDQKYSNVEYILLDPSCSGSGIVSRMDHLLTSVLEGFYFILYFFLFYFIFYSYFYFYFCFYFIYYLLFLILFYENLQFLFLFLFFIIFIYK